jgi:8-oxo-dGTP pyrophosphatase MutT (NUDIX family)
MAPGGDPARLGTRRIARTRYLTLERDYLIETSGRWAVREIVRHPGSVVVIPWDGSRVALIEQYRHATGRRILELPAGKLDVAGEPPDQTARRECVEEVGLDPGSLTLVHGCFASPGFTDEYSLIYLAEDLAPAEANPQGMEEEGSRIVWMTAAEAANALGGDGFEDSKTIVGIAALLARLP